MLSVTVIDLNHGATVAELTFQDLHRENGAMNDCNVANSFKGINVTCENLTHKQYVLGAL